MLSKRFNKAGKRDKISGRSLAELVLGRGFRIQAKIPLNSCAPSPIINLRPQVKSYDFGGAKKNVGKTLLASYLHLQCDKL